MIGPDNATREDTAQPWTMPGMGMGDPDRGSATAELAVALPALVLLLTVGVLAIATVTAKLGCVAQARDAALALARGQDPSTMDGISIERRADTVAVTVERAPVTCTAVAAMEPGAR